VRIPKTGPQEEVRDFVLCELPAPAGLAREMGGDRRVYAYRKTAETVDDVTVARDLDLRSLIPEHVIADEVPRREA
jgi:hypothetical protein